MGTRYPVAAWAWLCAGLSSRGTAAASGLNRKALEAELRFALRWELVENVARPGNDGAGWSPGFGRMKGAPCLNPQFRSSCGSLPEPSLSPILFAANVEGAKGSPAYALRLDYSNDGSRTENS